MQFSKIKTIWSRSHNGMEIKYLLSCNVLKVRRRDCICLKAQSTVKLASICQRSIGHQAIAYKITKVFSPRGG